MPGPIIVQATPDAWVFTFTMRRPDGRTYVRKVGVNGDADHERAYRLAVKHVNPPRATAEGRVHRIVGVDSCRLHQLAEPKQPYPVMDTMKV